MPAFIGSCSPDTPSETIWQLIHTKSRQEKALARDLSAMEITHYLPLVRRARYFGRRKKLIDTVLFPGYLFLYGTLDQAYMADRTRRVVELIKVCDQERLERELDNVRLALNRGAELDPCPYLKVGVRVEVRSGPFRGIQGYVDRKKKNDRLILQIDAEAFGRAASLELDGALLEPVA